MYYLQRTLKVRIATIMAAITMGAGAACACEPQDFKVQNLSWQPFATSDEHTVLAIGRLTSHCAEPSGAQVTVTFNDETGKPIAGESFWPDGVSDLPPGASYWFRMPISVRGKIGSLTATVIGTKRWNP